MFSCTNAGSTNVSLGVEVFGAGGGAPINDVAATSIIVPPGGTVLFGTDAANGWVIDRNLLGSTPVDKGSARVLATSSKGLLCSVCLVLATSGEADTSLPVVRKTTQQGD